MIANKEKLISFLNTKKLTVEEFAALLDIEKSEAEKLISGERVGYDTARKFIFFFKGEVAQHYIDWEATGVKNPLADDMEKSAEEKSEQYEKEDQDNFSEEKAA